MYGSNNSMSGAIMKASYEHNPIMSHSPKSLAPKQESEELEYLQAELSALRDKKD